MTIKIDFEGVRWVECSKVEDLIIDISERIINKKGKFGKTPECTLIIIRACTEELLRTKITALTGSEGKDLNKNKG